jgi:predicted nucleotidyltransferase
MTLQNIQLDTDKLSEFCRRNGIARLSAFGSILRDDFNDDSDIDLLVEFKSYRRVSLFDLGGMTMELKGLLGREIDLRTSEDLSRYFREDVVRSARPLYAGRDE